MKQKILCTVSEFAPDARTILDRCGKVTYAIPSQERFAAAVSDSAVLVVQLGLTVDRAVIDAAPNLRWIATATTGLDHIDVEYAEACGITVLSLKDEIPFLRTITATAELACGLMIALIRHLPAAHASVVGGRWDRPAFQGRSLRGKTLGVVGYGRLGTMMGRYGKAFGMRVIFTDPYVEGGVPLETLLAEADIVTLHVHLTKETENMLDAAAIARMKPGALLINTARAAILDEAAVLQALKDKRLGGYATDVLAGEFAFVEGRAVSPLIDYAKEHRNVLITPHIGGTTIEAREATDVFIVKKLRKALRAAAAAAKAAPSA